MPIVMNVEHTRIRGGYILHLIGDAANLVPIRPLHAELDRPANRRTKEEPVDLEPHARKIIGENAPHPGDDRITVFRILGHDQELREVLVLQLLIERQEEPGNAGADKGRDRTNVLIGEEAVFEADRLGFCLLIGRAFRQPKVREDLRPVRGREKLLRNEEEAGAREDKCRNRQRNDAFPAADAPVDDGAETAIARRIVNVPMTALGCGPVLEDHKAEPRREVDGGEPGYDERDAGHPEQRLHIFARGAGREADGDEASDRNQRAGEHRECRRLVSEGRGGKFAIALLRASAASFRPQSWRRRREAPAR